MSVFVEAVTQHDPQPRKVEVAERIYGEFVGRYSNQPWYVIGHHVGSLLEQAGLDDVAAASYEYGLQSEATDQYRELSARNYVGALGKVFVGLETTPQLRDWLLSKKDNLSEVTRYLVGLRDEVEEDEKKITRLRDGEHVIWATHERWEKYRALNIPCVNGTRLLAHMDLMIQSEAPLSDPSVLPPAQNPAVLQPLSSALPIF